MGKLISDMVDPDDEQGRTYREINMAKQHTIPLGTLVELRNPDDDDDCDS